MKKNYYTIILIQFILLHTTFYSQSIDWETHLGGSGNEWGNSIVQTSDGGYIIAGISESLDGDVSGNNGNMDYWIVKLDDQGIVEWENNFGGSNNDRVYSIQEVSGGGFIAAGSSSSSDGDVSDNNGFTDYWLIKLDNNGSLLWENNYGGSGYDSANAIRETSDGGYVVAGSSTSADGDVGGNKGNDDFWIIKIDGTGNLQWEENIGGSDWDFPTAIQQTSDNGYVVSGSSGSGDNDVSGNNGGNDFWIIKLDDTGALLWEKNYGGSGNDRSYAMQITTDGGYAIAGQSASSDGDISSNHGGGDYWMIKLDNLGELEWENTYGGIDADWAFSMVQTDDDGYAIAGYSQSIDGDVGGNNGGADYWIIKLDNLGGILWERNFGGSMSETPKSIQQTSDGWFILSGQSNSSDGDLSGNNGNLDYWIVKMDGSSSTGIDKNKLSGSYQVYPNPTCGDLFIERVLSDQQVNIEITDLNGSVLQKIKNNDEKRIKLTMNQPAGIYFVHLFTNNEQEVYKVVVR